MRKLVILFNCCLFSACCLAHPGIGIVKDSKGNIYYTDLAQVWKIYTTGKKEVVVPNVHTHELFMDAGDNLYGEHLWYNGEQADTWGHYVWRLKNDGRLEKEIKPTEGFLTNYSLVRDSAGNMYWVERFTVSRFKKKSKDGVITTILQGKFKDVRWIYATAKGEVFFIDLTDLYKIDVSGQLHLLAKNIA